MLALPFDFPLTVAMVAEMSGMSATKVADCIRGGGLRAHPGTPYTTNAAWVAEWADNGKSQTGTVPRVQRPRFTPFQGFDNPGDAGAMGMLPLSCPGRSPVSARRFK